MKRSSLAGEFFFYLVLLGLGSAISGCSPATVQSLLDEYVTKVKAMFPDPQGCNCTDYCRNGASAAESQSGCKNRNNGAKVEMWYNGTKYLVDVPCFCTCSGPWGGPLKCTWDDNKFSSTWRDYWPTEVPPEQ